MISPLNHKPFRTVLQWQVVATGGIAAIAAVWGGTNAMISAVLGGLVNIVAGAVYALVLGLSLRSKRMPDAGTSLMAMFRAEAGKIFVIIGGMWLVLTSYKDVVTAAFFAAFAVSVIVFSMAFFVRDK